MFVNSILLIIATTVFDKLRGQGKLPKALLTTCLFLAAFVAGISVGWGQPIGAYIADVPPRLDRAEWWQFGNLPEMPFVSVLVRAVIWAAPIAAVGFYDNVVYKVAIAVLIAFPLAAFITRKMLKNTIRAWEYHEYIRGLLVGILVVLQQW